ncbi:MAG: DUF3999 family protein [Vicinamibacterales bacterium]
MIARRVVVTVLVSWAAVVAAQPQAPTFSIERPVDAAAAGARRLPIDAVLLAAGAPFRVVRRGSRAIAEGGLSDLRLFDPAGREVPYLLVHESRDRIWRPGRVLPIAATKTTSGFEVDFGGTTPVDRVRVDGIPAPFLKRLALEGSGDRARWTLLQAEGTLFDLPDDRIANHELSFRSGAYRYLRITWNDTNSGRVPLPRDVQAREARRVPEPAAASTDLAIEKRPSEPGRSRYRLTLPGAGLPVVALDLDVAPGHVFRQATVSESRFAGTEAAPVVLGQGTLVRVLRADAAAESLRVGIMPPSETQIDLTVEDGSNPPLDLRKVSAVFAELPWIYLEGRGEALLARYGDRSAPPPSYDLEAARPSIDLAHTSEGRWGSARAIAAGTSTARPASPVSAGAVLEGEFRYSRTVPAAPRPGLAALPLDAGALSHSQGPGARFADVRLVDGSRRQIPYLLERRDEPMILDLALAKGASPPASLPPAQGGARSVYRVTMPEAGLPAATLTVETTARVFQRAVQLGVVRGPDRAHRDDRFDVVAATTWRHADEGVGAPALRLDLGTLDATELWLVVDEGDNAALPIDRARLLLLPSWRLRYVAPEGAALHLMYGRDDLPAPRYDLALLAPRLMGAAVTDVAAGPESARAATAALVSPRWFWIILTVAVVMLLGLIVRLARRA